MEKKIQQELRTAKKAGTENKKVPLSALKRKKLAEKQLEKINNILSNVEFQRSTLENVNVDTEVIKSLGFASKTLKNKYKQLDIDNVQDVIDDIQEQTGLANEISDVISSPVGFGHIVDDELMTELVDVPTGELISVPVDKEIKLPNAPTGELASSLADELKELEAWAC